MRQNIIQGQREELAVNAVRAVLVIWAIAAILQGAVWFTA